jgi:hypothetical protein
MRYLTDQQIRDLEAQAQAREIADEAEALVRRARSSGFTLEVRNVANEFGVVLVRPRDHFAAARELSVQP